MIRHGAQLAFNYARATVPRVAVVLRKAYGGAYIVMDSRPMGSDLYLAWPSAEVAVMGAKGAVEILHRRAAPDERAEAELAYEDDVPQPVARRRARLGRRRHRSRRHAPRGRSRARDARQQAGAARAADGTTTARCRYWDADRCPSRFGPWLRASRSPTTARATRSRSPSSTAVSTPPNGASCCPTSGSTTRRS